MSKPTTKALRRAAGRVVRSQHRLSKARRIEAIRNDYSCFVLARCGAPETASEVPREALTSLLRDTEAEADRQIIRHLRAYYRKMMLATGVRLRAEFLERVTFPPQCRRRPRKPWALRVGAWVLPSCPDPVLDIPAGASRPTTG